MEIHRTTIARILLDSGVFRGPVMSFSDTQVHPLAEAVAWAAGPDYVRFAVEGYPGEGLVYLQASVYRWRNNGWAVLDMLPKIKGAEVADPRWNLCGRSEFEAAAASGGRHGGLEKYRSILPGAQTVASDTHYRKRQQALYGFTEIPEERRTWRGTLSGTSSLQGEFELIVALERDGRPRWLLGFVPEGGATAPLIWGDRRHAGTAHDTGIRMDEGWTRQLAILGKDTITDLYETQLTAAVKAGGSMGFVRHMMYRNTSNLDADGPPAGLGRDVAGRWLRWIVKAQIEDWEVDHSRGAYNGNSKAEVFWHGKKDGRPVGGSLSIWNADRNGAQEKLTHVAAQTRIAWVRETNATRRRYEQEADTEDAAVAEPGADSPLWVTDL